MGPPGADHWGMPETGPSLVQSLLLENPWPAVIVLVGTWAVLRVLGTRAGRRWMNVTALGALALAGGMALLAWSVTTDHELLRERTRQLVQATTPLELGRLDALIGPETAIHGPDDEHWFYFKSARPRLQQVEIESQDVQSLGAHVGEDGAAVTVFELTTRLAKPAYSRPLPSRWRLAWERRAGAWRVTKITCRDMPEALSRQMQKLGP